MPGDIFTDWCFIQTFGLELGLKLLCQAKKGVGAGCSGSANYYKQKGQFHTSGPQPGDQIFFTNDGGKTMYHTGIVEKVAGGRVYQFRSGCRGERRLCPRQELCPDLQQDWRLWPPRLFHRTRGG